MRAFVGVTDGDWYRFLAARGVTEVNFWQPGGGRRFAAIERGAPFLFKTHFGDEVNNRIVGVGFFSGSVPLPVSRAWEIFGEGNGCRDEFEMRRRIAKYRRSPIGPADDPEIGCIMLRDVVFADPRDSLPAPAGWPRNVVQGKTYDSATHEGSFLEAALELLLARQRPHDEAGPRSVPGPVFGEDRLTRVRVGQRAFQALVLDSYGRRCAVTGDRIVPVLEAAHIRGVGQGGENRVDNGLLLRSDVHTLFDRGYLSVHPARNTLMVSPRLRSDSATARSSTHASPPASRSPCRNVVPTALRASSWNGTPTPCSRPADQLRSHSMPTPDADPSSRERLAKGLLDYRAQLRNAASSNPFLDLQEGERLVGLMLGLLDRWNDFTPSNRLAR